jgi:hypothetical protein
MHYRQHRCLATTVRRQIMAAPKHYAKPDLSHLVSRKMNLSAKRLDLDWAFHEWIADVVRVTDQPPENGNRAETILMATAKESIDGVEAGAPKAMAISQSNGPQTVYADFLWGRSPYGQWYVSAVCFGLHLDAVTAKLAQQQALKQSLLNKAESENATHLHLRKTVFPAEEHLASYTWEITSGDHIVNAAIEAAYRAAAEDGKALSNPVTPKAMLMSMGSFVLQPGWGGKAPNLSSLDAEERFVYDLMTKGPNPIKAAAHLAQEMLQEAVSPREALESTFEVAEMAHATVEAKEHLSDKEKSRGDKILDSLLDYSGFVPVAGPYIKTLVGMMLNVAISSDASRVTKIRSRCYIYYVAGYISKLTLVATGSPQAKMDKKYFDMGASAAPAVGTAGNFQAQVSLLHYASEHYTAGGWGGWGYTPGKWHFPDQYIIRWSPEVLGLSLATQLHTQKHLVENPEAE